MTYCELLKLDRQYYSTQDDSALREFFSKAVIAGKQIARRPMLLLGRSKKSGISKHSMCLIANAFLTDQSQPRLKWRWNEAHEAIHSVTEWHQMLLHGDNGLQSESRIFAMSNWRRKQITALAGYSFSRTSLWSFRGVHCPHSRSFEAPAKDSVTLSLAHFGVWSRHWEIPAARHCQSASPGLYGRRI